MKRRSISPGLSRSVVPLNIICSTWCAAPVVHGVSLREPTLYKTPTVATGAAWTGAMTTVKPLASVAVVASIAANAPSGIAIAIAMMAQASRRRACIGAPFRLDRSPSCWRKARSVVGTGERPLHETGVSLFLDARRVVVAMKPLASGIFSLALRWCAAAALLCAALALPQLAEAHSITPSASVALPGQPITFTAIATAPFNMSPTRVDFGDGSPIIFIPEPYPQFPVHTYALPGVYTVKLLEPAAPVTLAQTTVTIVSPATFSLTANPAGVIAGQVVMFTATTGAQKVPGAYVDFGDGSTAQLPSNFNAIQHRYASPAFYTARLLVVGGLNTLAQAQVTVTANSVQVPVGQVYSTFLVGSPVLAGADTAVALSYRIFTPFVIAPSGVSPLQAIVELSTAKGVVIQRSDPFALPFTQQNVNSAQTVMIPYTVPADAGGNYLITVYV